MYRCSFEDAAKKQIEKYRKINYRVGWLLTSKKKWGLDLDIDYCDDTIALEVLHLEWDSPDLELIEIEREKAEQLVLNTDWIDAAKRLWELKDQWQNLKGWYAQATLAFFPAIFFPSTLPKGYPSQEENRYRDWETDRKSVV